MNFFSSFIVISIIVITSDTLQELVKSLERKIVETEKKYEESSRIREERMNQIMETESRMTEQKTIMQRFL